MAKNKTNETGFEVTAFINSWVESEQKKADSFQLIELLCKWSGFEAKMWGPSIIGFGSYRYKYARGHEGVAPLLGFSPRKAAISLYVYTPEEENEHLLKNMGKFKMGKACIYVQKLSDIDLSILEKMCVQTVAYLHKHHECS